MVEFKDVLKLGIDIETKLNTRGIDAAKKRVEGLQRALSRHGPNTTPLGLDALSTETLKTNLTRLEQPLKKSRESIREYNQQLKNWQGTLLNVGLSVLFFGMALQRLSTSIIKSGISAFKKITEGSQDSAGALGVLEVHFTLLAFSIGAAINALLEAWLPTIIEVILSISDWIQEHEHLVAKLLLFGAAGGAGLIFVGTIISVTNGILGLLTQLGFLSPVLDKTTGQVNTVATAWSKLSKLVALGLLIHVGMKMLGRDVVPGAKDILGDALEAAFGAFLFRGLMAGIITFTIVALTELAAAALDLTTMELIMFSIEGMSIRIKQVWERILILINSSVRGLKAWAPGGETPLEAFKGNLEDINTLKEKQAAEMDAFDSKVFTARINNMLAEVARTLDPEILTLPLKEALPKLTEDQQKILVAASNTLKKDMKVIWEDLQKTMKTPVEDVDAIMSKTAETIQQTFVPAVEKGNETLDSIKTPIDELSISTENATEALLKMRSVMMDATEIWIAGQKELQKALGLSSTGPGTSAGINYNTGTLIGDAVLSSMFGGQLAGIGQFQAGALSEAAVGTYASTVAANRERPRAPPANITVVNNTQNNGTYVSGTSSGGDRGYI
ncbi:MAG: hypothetical protein Q8O88_01330 [bacterium]|nr:hypothetical protein [bacterium]